jgi:YidC/Oxa1 family membrane protein insertase
LFILDWLRTGVSWILVQFHALFSTFLPSTAGITWVLSIVGLVVVIRILLIPLFVKQIKAQRGLQLIQPQIKEIQKKYAGDRERQSQEMMKLYRETGTNPLSSCLPILLQAPIFFALFSVLQGIATNTPEGVFKWEQYAEEFESARFAEFLGVPLYGTFLGSAETPNPTATRILTLILIVLMSVTTFITQRQLIVKNTAPDNPIVRQQKILLYVFPLIFAIGGINFPVGVLIYWFTTNLWSMGQQFWVIRNNPQPGTPAYDAYEARKAAKAARRSTRKGGDTVAAAPGDGASAASTAASADEGSAAGATTKARVQPKKQPRSKRGGPPPSKKR